MATVTDAVRAAPTSVRSARAWAIPAVAVLTLASAVVCVGIGPAPIPPGEVLASIWHHVVHGTAAPGVAVTDDVIIWEVRLPRVVLGVAVGAGLALCGALLQVMVRNMLAEPYILGVTSGASTGAAASILFGVGAGLGEHALSASAFVGALAASVAVFLVARGAGAITSVRLLLAGVAVGYLLYAVTSFLILASPNPEGARSVMFWLLGSLSLGRWSSVLLVIVVVVLASTAYAILRARHLDALAVGDETAHAVGVRPTRLRIEMLVLVSLCTGSVVAMSGGIGFVGLVVPHVARRFVGAAHRVALPVAVMIGATFLIWADALARTLLDPQELPIGIITSVIGAPFLLLLVRRLHATP